MKVIKYSIFIFVLLSSAIFAQNSVNFEDATVDREHYVSLALSGTITGDNIKTLTVEIVYDSRIIDIKSASGKNGFAMQEALPEIKTDFTKLDSALLTITSHNAVAVNKGTICNLLIKGLVWSDSMAYVLPLKVLINGKEVSTDNLKQGIVKVLGNPIFPNFPDYLGNGYPNPFNYRVRFDFSLKKKSSVKFTLYKMNGVKVLDSDDSKDMLLVFSTKNGTVLNSLSNLEEGSYYVLLTPKNQEIASQYYLFVMQTDRQVFNTNIIYCK